LDKYKGYAPVTLSRKVDELDRKLIQLLGHDGRMSASELGKKLGISRMAAGRKMAQLISDGIIVIALHLVPNKTGAPIGALIGLQAMDNCVDPVAEILLVQPEVARVSLTSGRFNLISTVYFETVDDIARFCIETLASIDGLRKSEIFQFMPYQRKADQPFRLLDDTDRRLIHELQKDARLSVAEIARRLGIVRLTANNRLNRLIKEGRLSVNAMIMDGTVDWYCRAAVGLKVAQGHLGKVLEQLNRHSSVKFSVCTSGRFDILASVTAESRACVCEIVEREFLNIKGVIDTEIFVSHGMRLGRFWAIRQGSS
jgi:DNA-binding Lrp family transcriptional regulator